MEPAFSVILEYKRIKNNLTVVDKIFKMAPMDP